MTTEPSKELCYPFADRTCNDPRCSCRSEKLAALKATSAKPSERDMREAEEIISTFTLGADRQRMADRIARALAARSAVPAGHVRLSDGREPKVLGTLPMTADGFVIGHGAVIHCVGENREGTFIGAFQSTMTECDDFSAEAFDGSNWFSTREAADAAARGGER